MFVQNEKMIFMLFMTNKSELNWSELNCFQVSGYTTKHLMLLFTFVVYIEV